MDKCYVVHRSITIPGENDVFEVRLFKTKESAQLYAEESEIYLREEYQNELDDYGEECISVWISEQEIED